MLVELDYIFPFTFEMKYDNFWFLEKIDKEKSVTEIAIWCSDNLEGKFEVKESSLSEMARYKSVWVTLSSESDCVMFKTYWQPEN